MNGYNFTDHVRLTLQRAREIAARRQNEYVGVEHILLGMLDGPDEVIVTIFGRLGVAPDLVVRMVEALAKPGDRPVGRGPELPYTSRAKKGLELAMLEARELGDSYVGDEHLLAGLVREERGIAAQVLAACGVSLGGVHAAMGRSAASSQSTDAGAAMRNARLEQRAARQAALEALPETVARFGRRVRVAMVVSVIALAIALLALAHTLAAQSIPLPPRPADAPGGAALIDTLAQLDRDAREARIVAEVLRGNVPGWLRTMATVEMRRTVDGVAHVVRFRVAPDYLAIGSDTDWFLAPLSPLAAQRIADRTGTSLPTPPMVDAIWRAATVRLPPDSIAPSAAMITIPVMAEHDRRVHLARGRDPAPLGAVVAGHKKDVVLTARLDTLPVKVAIYGWQRADGSNIQPLYTGHVNWYADYSHGIRLVDREITIDGQRHDLVAALEDPRLAPVLLDDGPMHRARYHLPGDPP